MRTKQRWMFLLNRRLGGLAPHRQGRTLSTKRSICIAEHKTSISLEDTFWATFRQVAAVEKMHLGELVALIGSQLQGNLSSAIRLFVLSYYQELANPSSPTLSVNAGTSDDQLVQQAY